DAALQAVVWSGNNDEAQNQNRTPHQGHPSPQRRAVAAPPRCSKGETTVPALRPSCATRAATTLGCVRESHPQQRACQAHKPLPRLETAESTRAPSRPGMPKLGMLRSEKSATLGRRLVWHPTGSPGTVSSKGQLPSVLGRPI